MKTNTLLVIIISLLVGGGIGYSLNTRSGHYGSMIMNHDVHDMHEMHTGNEMDMETMMMDMTSRMEGVTGDKLDRIFLEDMIIHHQGAVDMAIIIKDQTNRSELKNFAQEIIDVQDQEINMMRGWLSQWFSA